MPLDPVVLLLRGTITAEAITAFVENRVPESRTLEYKEALPGKRDEERREFAADVTAMANTGGGTILYGITHDPDNKALPQEVIGVGTEDLDEVHLRLGGILEKGVSPSLVSSVTFETVSVSPAATPVLVVRVPRSLAAPHRVIAQGSNRFWRRSDAGKYEPDVPELRRMFLESQSLRDQAHAFRVERVEQIRHRRIRPDLQEKPLALVHLLPVGRLDRLVDLRPHRQVLANAVAPMGTHSTSFAFNADGFWVTSTEHATVGITNVTAYTQWFRFGGVEMASAELLDVVGHGSTTLVFEGGYFVRQLREQLPAAVRTLRETLDTEPPFAFLVSLVGFSGRHMRRGPNRFVSGGAALDRDLLLLPPVMIDGPDPESLDSIRPALDMLWQAFGSERVPDDYMRGELL